MIKINVGPHTVDELGKWQGGVKKGVPNWVGLKSRSTHTGDFKNTSGKASNGVVERSPKYFKQGNNLGVTVLENLPATSTSIEEGQ